MVKVGLVSYLFLFHFIIFGQSLKDYSVISFSKAFIVKNEFHLKNSKKLVLRFNQSDIGREIIERKSIEDSNFINILKNNYWNNFENITSKNNLIYSCNYCGTKTYFNSKIKYHFYIVDISSKEFNEYHNKKLYALRVNNDSITHIIFNSKTNFSDQGGGRYAIIKKNKVIIKLSSIPVLFRGWFVAYRSKDYIFTYTYNL